MAGVDGCGASLTALDRAVDGAVRHGLPLRIVHASLRERHEGVVPACATEQPSGQILAENIVGTAAERARRRAPDLPVTADVLAEDASSALLGEGGTGAILVVGSRGRGEFAGLLRGDGGPHFAERSFEPFGKALADAASEHPRVHPRRTTVEGPAHRVLTERSAADLLVVGARRRDGRVGPELGRVAHRALHHADRPVAVVSQRRPERMEGER
ncbi:universal stress protein [Streptomyces sp. SR27]|uniref:universal stress protein n=1 Tax=Streptomyces sp. SR27 TaxID=3076630 RepID=UPI00295A8C7E|nr:universal stress protein [Streptomyces sp. SR27]MDV9186710.1 universal stress protein [Streptomyces sp. SR27]